MSITEPDELGIYTFPDGSQVRPCRTRTGEIFKPPTWVAVHANNSILLNDSGGTYLFSSPQLAAQALALCGEGPAAGSHP